MKHVNTDYSGASQGTYRSYATGFILSLLLTIIAFGSVWGDLFSMATMLTVLFTCAAIQIFVQLSFFLHMNTSSETRWNLVALVFTVLIMALFIGGSLWIMAHLHYRMM